ncbi:RNA polymerase sigma factor FliA [Helicobacter canadensis]|uniref:Flagellar biosynthesis sigma factor FliA n=1 Tax=Helicobacter canadensis MIT 98-5491 TaxID=537970 RepID=C5ZY41_9HELI|nr:RNA polymerase sigma factor FliA [Helicobacter canadensis]EES90059.1 flagellar biosynthesis sigma factor FliA [Helicobacter canadensis MIT 98-5491]EFR49210.1 flagellar biosynthesis sigma factor [Helicobacter canadensis MIT 98-5491]STP02438.1 flagellar biosynthesis sigma factor [Helicobacter canadensis]
MLKTSKGYENIIKQNQDNLALDYLPALKALAARLKERLPANVEFADLVSIGTEELIKLARKYDQNLNDSFWGYAKSRVYGAMLDYLRGLDCMSRHTRTLIKSINKEISKYYNEYQEEPDNAYLSKVLNEDIEKIKEARNASEIYGILPLDEELSAAQEDKTYNKIEKQELIGIIQNILESASKNEQLVIQLYYYEELSFKEISEILEISESRISQIHKSVIRKIRAYLEERGIDG